MTIKPIRDPLTVAAQRDSQHNTEPTKGVEASARTKDWKDKHKAEHEELKAHAAQNQLEVRLYLMPHTDVIIIRFVEPASGQVVKEFPSERLAQVLAEMRAQSAEKLAQSAMINQRV